MKKIVTIDVTVDPGTAGSKGRFTKSKARINNETNYANAKISQIVNFPVYSGAGSKGLFIKNHKD